jgi:glucosamine-6-phosphate deaminase
VVANELGFLQTLPSAATIGAKRSAIIEELNSPKEKQTNGFKLEAPKPEITRSVTPELIPDRMASRIPDVTRNLQGVGTEDMRFLRMGARVAPLTG